jgi:HK97 family phage prohead protease
MNETIRKQFVDTDVRAVRDRVRRFTISTASVDRDNDTIDPRGWRLDNYRKNPVVLWAHDYRQLPLGKALDVRVEGTRLVSEAEFADHEMADTVLKLIDDGFLRATSVGFKPVRFERNVERGGIDFKEQELLEFSVVPVGANPEAIRRMKAARLCCGDEIAVELTDVAGDIALELVEEADAEWRRDFVAQCRAAAEAGLRAQGFHVGGDPLIDPAERSHVQDMMRQVIRESIHDVVRETAIKTIGQLRGRVD